MTQIEIRQIFYDEVSLSLVQAPFIPLDNSDGDKSWFEFWGILYFLLNHKELEENVFYGFFSPKFTLKTGLSAQSAIAAVRDNSDKDVVLFSYAWDQLCFFINPWEQGETFHPGITKATQDFVDQVGLNIKISEIITSRKNSVYSNFIVAKKSYWDKWIVLATLLLRYAENRNSNLFNQLTSYERFGAQPMKVFIQERLPALILADKALSVAAIDVKTGMSSELFVNSTENKKRLLACDRIKDKIIEVGLSNYLIGEFNTARKQVLFNEKKN